MKFIIDVPEGCTACKGCPFYQNDNVCDWLAKNHYCTNYDFQNLHIEEHFDSK